MYFCGTPLAHHDIFGGFTCCFARANVSDRGQSAAPPSPLSATHPALSIRSGARRAARRPTRAFSTHTTGNTPRQTRTRFHAFLDAVSWASERIHVKRARQGTRDGGSKDGRTDSRHRSARWAQRLRRRRLYAQCEGQGRAPCEPSGNRPWLGGRRVDLRFCLGRAPRFKSCCQQVGFRLGKVSPPNSRRVGAELDCPALAFALARSSAQCSPGSAARLPTRTACHGTPNARATFSYWAKPCVDNELRGFRVRRPARPMAKKPLREQPRNSKRDVGEP